MHAYATPAQGHQHLNRPESVTKFKTALKPSNRVPLTPLIDAPHTAPQRKHKPTEKDENRASVILILDHQLQAMPWESILNISSSSRHTNYYRLPSLPCFAAATRGKQEIDLTSCFYSINPGGDLLSTQNTFEHWFSNIPGWTGKAGVAPNSSELSSALQNKDLFVYCGHGGGEQYLSIPKLRSLDSCASSLLMGCSSGRLRLCKNGMFEPTGIVLAYMLAGCPSTVATLWDVTDKDIDRYCQAIITTWLSKRSEKSKEVGHVAHGARTACRLPYLIGAAPVCYGVPTRVIGGSSVT